MATFDAGGSWTTVHRGQKLQSWQELGFTTATQGVAVARGEDEATGTLLQTLDGGPHLEPGCRPLTAWTGGWGCALVDAEPRCSCSASPASCSPPVDLKR